MALTRNEVITVLGSVDDALVAQVIGTGATREELAEAQAWIANDEPMMSMGRPLAGGRVAELVDLLGRIDEEELAREDQ